ncbi:hypothetical protein [Alkalibacterium kapii]|uniref:DUF3892 domain-containing protein n=1 Tax=Alkalibacterium kapii TaxID=426704 RepID=A0A511ARM5_9LACT|nr:hypothetical protein [Alkalibacterium kapii]GEK90736.1 hypothetical protein AKA01nite_03580 [Alkalibacterium kapii]
MLLYAAKIKMSPGCTDSLCCQDIESIYLEGLNSKTFHLRETVHALLKYDPKTVAVKNKEIFILEAATSPKGDQYVRTANCPKKIDPLLSLPRL